MGEKETTVEETRTNVGSTGMEEQQTEVKETAEEKEVEKTEETSTVEEEKVEETSAPASEETTSENKNITTIEEGDKSKDSSNSGLDENIDELQQLKNENIKLKVAREHNLNDEALKILGEVDDTYSQRAKTLASLLNKSESKESRRDPNIGVTGSKVWDGNSWLRDTIGR